MKVPDLRNQEWTTSSGCNVRETSQLKGEAKDSLSGTNTLKQFTTSGDAAPGTPGGMANFGNPK